MRRHRAIIAYDIVSTRRRNKIFRCLQTWKLDSQHSLFECKLSHREAEELFLELTEIIDAEEDELFLAWLDSSREPLAFSKQGKTGFQTPVWYAG